MSSRLTHDTSRWFIQRLNSVVDEIGAHSADSDALDDVPCGILYELNDADVGLSMLAWFLAADDPTAFLLEHINKADRLIELGYGPAARQHYRSSLEAK